MQSQFALLPFFGRPVKGFFKKSATPQSLLAACRCWANNELKIFFLSVSQADGGLGSPSDYAHQSGGQEAASPVRGDLKAEVALKSGLYLFYSYVNP